MTTHGSIFTGIGGIDLGFQWAGIETIWQVERDPFCLRTLKKNFPEAKRFTDVRECGRHNLERVDIVSGGFPCQDISVAGNKKGIEHGKQSVLWLDMARIVRELRPRFAFIENVDRLLDIEDGDRVLSEMEEAGYDCWPLVLGAEAMGATHRRLRTWILCRRIDTDRDQTAVAEVGSLPQEAAREMARAVEGWKGRARELASGTVRVEGDAYARIVRDRDGISAWLDRHHALGNAVVPQIATLFGCFIQNLEAKTR